MLNKKILKSILNVKHTAIDDMKILPDGTITKDMRGHYNDPDKNVPVHEKCISCQYNQYCPSYKMFPHFVKDVLDKIEDPHFCKTARWIYNHENKVLS